MFGKSFYNWSMSGVIFTALLGLVFLFNARAGCWFPMEPIYSVDEYDDVRCKDMSSIDISDRPNLPATLWFSQETIWPSAEHMPAGCDPNQIMTNAMNPGLGIRALHQQGFTGAGVRVAIIDQDMFQDHPEFAGKVVAYYDLGDSETSMHGPAVTSLLVGTNCGTAPDAQLYYVSCSQTYDTNDYAEGLDWIVGQSESLPASEKIRVVSISAVPDQSPWTYREQYRQARDRAEAAGILVLDLTDRNGFTNRGWYDPNDPENVAKFNANVPGYPPPGSYEGIYVPSTRTTAEEVYQGDFSYQYTGRGGLSWTAPYCAGVLAMGWQIRPELTGEQMVDLLFQTAYVNPNGAKIINPSAFISVLNSDKPVIGMDTAEINFYTVTGEGNPKQQILFISNIGFGTLNWVLDFDCNWLSVEPNSGSSVGFSDVDEVTLTVTDISVIPRSCELVISDPCAINSPRTVVVKLCLGNPYDGKNYVPSEYETIQTAIDDCSEGDIVVIEPGTYTGTGNRDLDFNGKAITVRSTNPNDFAVVAATIIDCNGSESEPQQGFNFHTNEDANSVLSGLTITGAYGSFGGAIICHNCSPTIINCVFVDNSVSLAGGGIHNVNSNPTLINCIFGNNSSNWIAGAIRNHTSSPVLINCLFTGNSASSAGGVMQNENDSSNPILINCTCSGNSTGGFGGGICNSDATPILTNCIFWGNSDRDGSDESAQIHGGTPIVNYSCIQGWTGGLGGVGNIGDDPCFVDAGIGDYHLLVGSPCINTGDPNHPVDANESDIDGQPRIIGGRVDIGADEFHGNNMKPLADAGKDQIVYGWTDWQAEVTLDGTGSYDDDGHCLIYNWTWVVDGNRFEADGPNPVVTLPVGEYIITLIVNDRVEDSEPDSVTISVLPPVEAEMKITPQSLNCKSKGNWVKAHIVLPEGFTSDDVDVNESAFAELPQDIIDSEYIKVFGNDDGPVRLEIGFDRQVLCDFLTDNSIVPDNNPIEIVVVGYLTTGQYFYGSDSIRIR